MKQKASFFGRMVLSVLCLFGLLARPAYAGIEDSLSARLDAYLRLCAENAHIPALSVTVVDKDQVLFSQSYGGCESGDTPFLLGSVSKSFTAVCIMQLAEQGKVDLNADLSVYLPHMEVGGSVTVGQLLNHTGGLGEYQTLENARIVQEQGVHHYANVNYSLLGEIIEAVSGQPYPAYIAENVFEPLGLSHTAATWEGSLENGLIDGSTNYWGVPVQRRHRYPFSSNAWITVPAGYLSSSTDDLGRYLQMYLNGGERILSEESIQTMFYGDTVYVEGDIPFRYGYGWAEVRDPLPEPVLRHSGLIETGTSCVFILPESGLAVAVTANVNDYFVTNEMMDRLGWGIVLMLLGEPPNEIPGSEYPLSHLRINLVMLAVLTAAVLGTLLPLGKKRGKACRATLFLLIHLVLPVLILLIVPVFFATPLWVARDFVPDVFITVAVSSALLFAGGLIKAVRSLHRYFSSK